MKSFVNKHYRPWVILLLTLGVCFLLIMGFALVYLIFGFAGVSNAQFLRVTIIGVVLEFGLTLCLIIGCIGILRKRPGAKTLTLSMLSVLLFLQIAKLFSLISANKDVRVIKNLPEQREYILTCVVILVYASFIYFLSVLDFKLIKKS